MNAPLRRRHRATVTLLAVLVPAMVLMALAARTPAPTDRANLSPPSPAGSQEIETFPGFIGRMSVEGGGILTLEGTEELRQPDVLAYFSTSAPGDSLPVDVHLLGPVAYRQARSFPLPDEAAAGGHLILYSLAHQEVLQVSEFPGFELPAPAPDPLSEEENPVDSSEEASEVSP